MTAERAATPLARVAGYALLAVGVLLSLAGLGAMFAAIWAHGHDLPSRLAGSGFYALFVGGGAVPLGWALVKGDIHA